MKKLILVLLLLISSISFAQRIEFVDSTGHLRQVSAKYPLPTVASVAFPDSLKVYFDNGQPIIFPDSVKTWQERGQAGYYDTLTATTPFRTYDFDKQYLHVIATVRRIDTNAVVWDSVYFYNIDEHGDTSAIGVRWLQGVVDSNLVRVNWTNTARNSSREFLIFHPAINLLHVRIENYALEDRKIIIGLTGVK